MTRNRITYIACGLIAGTARAAAAAQVDAVQWVLVTELEAYVPDGLYAAAQEYLDEMASPEQKDSPTGE